MPAFNPYEYPPEDQLKDLTSMMEWMRQVQAADASITEEMGINVANFTRYYPTASGELTAAVGMANVPWDTPGLQELVDRETEGGVAALKWVVDAAKQTTRTGFNLIDSIQYQYREWLPRWVTRMAQGENPIEASRNAGLSPLGVARLGAQRGLPVTSGEGWLPSPQDPSDSPEYIRAYNDLASQIQAQPTQEDLEAVHRGALAQANVPIDVRTVSDELGAQTTFTPFADAALGNNTDVPVTWGRLFAGTVFPSDTLPFKVMSGAVDASSLVITDPLNPVAWEYTAAKQSRRLLIPDGANNSAILQGLGGNKWRPWVKKPDGAYEWLVDSEDGADLIDWISRNGPAAVTRKLPDFPHETLRDLGRSSNKVEIANLLLPELGIRNRGRKIVVNARDRTLGARTYFDPDYGAAGGWVTAYDETPRQNWWRRMAASGEQGYLRIDPYDPNGTAARVLDYLDSVGADPGEMDEIVDTILDAGTEYSRYGAVIDKIETAIVSVLDRKGADAEFIQQFIREWEIGQVATKNYHQDEAGNVIFELGMEPVQLVNSGGEVIAVPRASAIMETQFTDRNIYLPALRDVRQATSKVRLALHKWGLGPAGIAQEHLERHALTLARVWADKIMSGWRAMALARLGWPLRVLPDEYLRILGSGYVKSFNPFTALALQMGIKGDFATHHPSAGVPGLGWDDWVEFRNGYGTGNPMHDAYNRPLRTHTNEFNAQRAAWTPVETRRMDGSWVAEGKSGLREQFLLLHNDPLYRRLHNTTDNEAYLWLMSPESQQWREEIANRADAGTLLHRLRGEEPDPVAAREVIMRMRAHTAQYTGGWYLYREVEAGDDAVVATRRWIRSDTGEPINLYDINPETNKVYTNAELRDILAGPDGIDPGRPVSRLNKEQLRRAIFEEQGIPFLDDIHDDQRYVIMNRGSERIQHFIYEGADNYIPWEPAAVSPFEIEPGTREGFYEFLELGWEMPEEQMDALVYLDDFLFDQSEQHRQAVEAFMATHGSNQLDANLWTIVDRLDADDRAMLGIPEGATPEEAYDRLNDIVTMRMNRYDDYVNAIGPEQAALEVTGRPGPPSVLGSELGVGAVPDDPRVRGVVRLEVADRGRNTESVTAEGYVFYGGAAGKMQHSRGGISHDLTRALGYAESQYAEGVGRVYVMRVDDLPEEVQAALANGDVEWAINRLEWEEYKHYLDLVVDENGVPKAEYLNDDTLPPWVWVGPDHQGHLFVIDEPLQYFDELTPDQTYEKIANGWLYDYRDRPRIITEDMSDAQHVSLEEWIPRLYDETYRPPATVPYADPRRTNRLRNAYDEVMQRVFMVIGGTPTIKLMRSPYFKVKYVDEMARWYLFADDATRAQIVKLMDDVKMRSDFDYFLYRHQRNYNMPELPAAGQLGDFTFDDFDELGRTIALDEVKNLLYDLSQSNNFMDSMRLIVPFGDAWWEVISRWAHLLNPVANDGQALLNLRRPGQMITRARQNGWFEEDPYGNEVFNLPVTVPGTDFIRGGFRLQPKAALSQFTFVDPGNPRSVLLPGFGPVIQMPAALISYALPDSAAAVFNDMVYGEFAPANPKSPAALIQSGLPTPWRRMINAFFEDEFRDEYGNDQVSIYNGLCMSNDARFDCSTVEGQTNAVNEANAIARDLSFLRILEAWVYPAQPRHVAEVELWEHIQEADGNEKLQRFMVETSALTGEYALARERFGPEGGWEYMVNRYGVDPTNLLPSTRAVKPRPYTTEAFRYLDERPDLRKYADLTLVAFLPSLENDALYSPAWNESRWDGTRVPVTLDEVPQMQRESQGNRALFEHNKLYEELVRSVTAQLNEQPATRQRELEKLRQWHNMEVDSILAQYMEIGDDNNLYGRVESVGAGDFLEEVFGDVKGIGRVGTEANIKLKAVNPELVGFLEFAYDEWEMANQLSRAEGNRSDWWRSTETTRILAPGEQDRAYVIRNRFVSRLQQYVATMINDPIALTGAQWYAERMFTPLLAGWDYNDPIIIAPRKVPDLSFEQSPGDMVSPRSMSNG